MPDTVNTRELALDILLDVTKQGEYSHIAAGNVLDKYQYLDKKDRAFITRMTEGTLENLIQIDYIIDQFSKVPVRNMKPVIRCILQGGVYQIRFMDSVPDSAACNEAVRLAKKRGFRNLSGFVNGVLRNISRGSKPIVWPDKEKEPEAWLSVRYSIPEWMIRMWKEEFGCHWENPQDFHRMEQMLQSFSAPAPVTVRTNTDRCTPGELARRLKAEGVTVARCEELPYALRISGYDHIRSLSCFQEGLFYVQDISSMLAAQTAEPKEHEFVLDVCAAPGGKALHIAQMMHGTGQVLARDLTQYKVDLLQENISRCGTANVQAQVWDARILDESLFEKADIVIADLPCSGLGVMRRKKDIRYKMTPDQIRELAGLQREILAVVQQYVRPGGRMVYSTCTVSRQENEDNTQWFLKEYADFKLISSRQILPQAAGADGFYIAKFQKAVSGTQQNPPDNHNQSFDPSVLPDIRSMNLSELTAFLTRLGEKPFRVKQIFTWLHQKQIAGFEEMTNISKELRSRLRQTARLTVLKPMEVQESRLDGTRKYLFALPDGNMIESVLMRYRYGNSVCISSQVGCRMACRFCASAIGGLVRNLQPSEMLEQIYRIGQDIGERISNVVVMGTGEPLDNYENLLRFLELLTHEQGLHMSQRNITISTCGIVPKIRELADRKLQITLALSLHAPTQEKRLTLMPAAAQYELSDVMEACDYYFARTGRRMTFEYSLIHGVNDTKEDAQLLGSLLGGKNCHVNLIPINPVTERSYVQPDDHTTLVFKNELEKKQINVTIRRELGRDIDGACGQLRKKYVK